MALERTLTIPLRKEWLNAPKYRRAKRAVAAVFDFLGRHMKSSDVKLGRYLNLEIWKHGINNPPSRVRVTAKKDDKGAVFAELFDAPIEKKVQKVEKKKSVKSSEESVEVKK
ncbi:MAG: 50S ribosomal protein L31e [Candidatus Aenigmarchaeota archaeon]|nr:50S ribosomal protein L31e [Candidatus Aenigmarchaeota archaeon]